MFEIGLCSAKERGHGRLGRVETGLVAHTPPSGTKEHANAHRRDALCPSPKNPKASCFCFDIRPRKHFCASYLKSPADIERDAFRAMLIGWATIQALIETPLQGKKFAEI